MSDEGAGDRKYLYEGWARLEIRPKREQNWKCVQGNAADQASLMNDGQQ